MSRSDSRQALYDNGGEKQCCDTKSSTHIFSVYLYMILMNTERCSLVKGQSRGAAAAVEVHNPRDCKR